jgi:AcrR family transcriptional regulator
MLTAMADALGIGQIVRGAVELLDAEGVDGLSMRRLGARLGSGATSIYWYVKNKDELIVLAVDEVFAEIELPDPAGDGWREAVLTSARGLRAMILRHPWLVQAIAMHPTAFGPRIARYQEHALGVFETAGLRGADPERARSTVVGYVMGMTLSETAERADINPEVLARARGMAAPYPRVVAWLGELESLDVTKTREESFDFGLRVLLDGLTAQLDR